MKIKINRKLCWILTPFIISVISYSLIFKSVPSTIFVHKGQTLIFNPFFKFKINEASNNSVLKQQSDEIHGNLSILGLLPLKDVSLNSIPDNISVYPGGQPIGVKLNTKGVLVIALCDLEGLKGKVTSPASTGGIQIGDSILLINGKEIEDSEEAASIINSCNGNEIILTIDRNGTVLEKKILPVKSKSDLTFKIGLWIRDSTAGVGTLTFYDDKTKKFAALGHPITDIDTGTILKVNSGEIVSSSIVSIRKGAKGTPGELKGIFINEDNPLGKINKNTICGITGSADKLIRNRIYSRPIKIGLRYEIKEGPAKILTTVDGEEPKEYDILIERLLPQDIPGPKSMILRITDKELLQKTGGIVQGMSGSPIIQEGKLVGAVTHVLVNKPDTGYGIYIEWMIEYVIDKKFEG